MLSKPPIVPQLSLPLTINEQPIAPLSEDPQTNPTSSEAVAPVERPPVPEPDRPVEDVRELHLNAAAGHIRISFRVKISRRVPATVTNEQPQRREARVQMPLLDECLFTLAAIGLATGIMVVLV